MSKWARTIFYFLFPPLLPKHITGAEHTKAVWYTHIDCLNSCPKAATSFQGWYKHFCPRIQMEMCVTAAVKNQVLDHPLLPSSAVSKVTSYFPLKEERIPRSCSKQHGCSNESAAHPGASSSDLVLAGYAQWVLQLPRLALQHPTAALRLSEVPAS